MRGLAAIGCVLLVLPAACGGAGEGSARVILRLAASDCEDFCADSQGAILFRAGESVPLGDGRYGPCGQPLVFAGLPAGHQVMVRAWVSRGSARLLQGDSAIVTVLDGQDVTAAVDLEPVVRPRVVAVTPDPAVPAAGAELVIRGEGFGSGAGWSRVELDGQPLGAVSWDASEVRASLAPGASGRRIQVRACGIPSEPVDVRVVATPPGVATLRPPGCPGWSARAFARVPGAGETVVAADCGEGAAGYLLRFLDATCTVAGETLEVPGRPRALATASDGRRVFAALEAPSAVMEVPLDGTPIAAMPDLPGVPEGLAVSGEAVFARVRPAAGNRVLVRLGPSSWDPVKGLSHLDLTDVAAGAPGVWVSGRDGDGLGSVSTVDEAGNRRAEQGLPGCDEPGSLAVSLDGAWVVASCGGLAPGLAVLRVDAPPARFLPLPGAPGALAVDRSGSGILAWDASAGRLTLVNGAGPSVLGSSNLDASVGPAVLAVLDGDRFLLAGPAAGQLTVVSPYASAAPCGEGGAP